MSRRIRTVKPEWLEDEALAAASDEARVLSIGLILMADDFGNGRASIATIAAEVWRFALEHDDGANAPEVLAKASRAFRELLAIGFIGTWAVGGQRYYAIRNWRKHQRVDRPGKALVPSPPSSLFDTENIEQGADSRDSRESLARVSGTPRDTLATDLDLDLDLDRDRDLEGTNARAREQAPPLPPPETHEERSEVTTRAPSNRSEALKLSVRERHEFVERNRHMAEWVEPEKWPEVVAVAQVVHDKGGGRGALRLASYARDNGVQALVTLFAAGFEQGELEQVARTITQGSWWTSTNGGKPRSLGALTVEVVRRELAERLSPQRARPGAPSGPQPDKAQLEADFSARRRQVLSEAVAERGLVVEASPGAARELFNG